MGLCRYTKGPFQWHSVYPLWRGSGKAGRQVRQTIRAGSLTFLLAEQSWVLAVHTVLLLRSDQRVGYRLVGFLLCLLFDGTHLGERHMLRPERDQANNKCKQKLPHMK